MREFKTKLALMVLLLAAAIVPAHAAVRIASIFSDHAVLQRDAAVPVWGWADPGESVTVTLGEASQTAKAGQDGKWTVKFEGLKAGGPLTLTAKGTNTVVANDVLVGEVWLCSGQSNMAMTVSGVNNAEAEAAKANNPQIRMFIVTRAAAPEPQAECQGAWSVCAPDTVVKFSATAYFFGREIQKELGVPVGLINSSVGGTPVQAWTSMAAMKAVPELKPILEAPAPAAAPARTAKKTAAPAAKAAKKTAEPAAKAARKADPNARKAAAAKRAAKSAKTQPAAAPGQKAPAVAGNPNTKANAVLFNAMIAPLVPYAIRGAIWYQGENNANSQFPQLYGRQLATLIQDWRARWGQGDFPFAWVQLPNYNNAKADGWPTVRDQMRRTLAVDNTGMATTMDIGDPGNIHPKNKQEVGRRLSLWALGKVYGQKVPATSGPLLKDCKVEGAQITLAFDQAQGLKAQGGELKGFEAAGADGQWKPAAAKIEGEKVIVSSPEVKEPKAARYDWANNPEGNLFNGAGLPASPFTTENK